MELALGMVTLLLLMLSVGPTCAGTINYTYDIMGRMIQAAYGDGTVVEYTYDKMGNREQKVVFRTISGPGGSGPVMLWSGAPVNYFSDPQAAHNDSAANGKTIRAWAMTFSENLTITKAVTLIGGYSADFASPAGYTTIEGKMTIDGGGAATVSNLILR